MSDRSRVPAGADLTSDALPADVAAAMAEYPEAARSKLLEVRALIFRTAACLDEVGPFTNAPNGVSPLI
jgi:hypothetical protein